MTPREEHEAELDYQAQEEKREMEDPELQQHLDTIAEGRSCRVQVALLVEAPLDAEVDTHLSADWADR